MQKRAALAKQEAEYLKAQHSEHSRSGLIGDSSVNPALHNIELGSAQPELTVQNQGDLNPDSSRTKTHSEDPHTCSTTDVISPNASSVVLEAESNSESFRAIRCKLKCTSESSDTATPLHAEQHLGPVHPTPEQHPNNVDNSLRSQTDSSSDLPDQSNVTITHFDLSLFPKD